MREKRSEHRVYKMARVEVVWMDETGIQHISQGKLEDLSEGGMCIRVNDQIDAGSTLIARTPFGDFSGTVVNTHQQGGSCVLGIKRDAA